MGRISREDRERNLMETAKKFEDGFKRRGEMLEKCKSVLNTCLQGIVIKEGKLVTVVEFLIMVIDEELDGKKRAGSPNR